jgi:transposase-like protein
MMKRIAATEKTRERLQALIDGRLGTGADRSDLVRLAVQLIIEEVLEAEARDKLGRERYERAEGEPSGYRNGLCFPKIISERNGGAGRTRLG